MPRYIIERTAPGLTRDELEAVSRRSMAAIESMTGVRWIRSYVSAAEGKIYCEYDAPDPEAIREHARRAGLPVDRISEVWLEISPAMFVTPHYPQRGVSSGTDPEQRLGHELVREHRISRMNAAQPGIAENLLEFVPAENAESAADLHRQIHDAPRAFDRVIFRGENLRRPGGAVIDAVRPVLRDAAPGVARSARSPVPSRRRDVVLPRDTTSGASGRARVCS